MTELLTIPNITFAIGILGVIFTVYNYFKSPQIKSENTENILALEIKQLKEEIANLRDNHIHALEIAIKDTNTNLNILTLQVGKLSTVMEERLPRRNVV